MTSIIEDTATPPPHLLTLLKAHLPKSHPLLRRLQFSLLPSGSSPHARVLFAAATPSSICTPASRFAAIYADLSRGPETEIWIFSTLEGDENETSEDSEQHLMTLFRRVRTIAKVSFQERGRARFYGQCVMVGSMCERVREVLLAKGLVMPYRNPHVKYIFRVDDLPETVEGDEGVVLAGEAGIGMRWDTVRKEDVTLIISRTHIPKTEETLLILPSLCVRLADETIIAWGFLAVDGSFATLHVEEGYRRKGLAKVLAVKLIRTHNGLYGDDGYCTADVHVDNKQSQGVCESIGGKPGWHISWCKVELDSIGEGI